MNKQEKPILHNSSTDKLVININGNKMQNGNTFCCLHYAWYFMHGGIKKSAVQMILSWVIVLLTKLWNRNTKILFPG